jgi:hypothetical protein
MARVMLVLAVVASLTAAAPVARAAGGCDPPRDARVRAQNARTVVYTVRRDERIDLYACDRRSGEARRFNGLIQTPDFNEELDNDFRLRGRYVAYSISVQERGGQAAFLEVYDLEHWKFARHEHVGGHGGDQRGPNTRVVDLVLTRDARTAWTTRTYHYVLEDDPAPVRQRRLVCARDGRGRVQLDHGAGIDLRSLTLSHGRVRWMHAGSERSARLR